MCSFPNSEALGWVNQNENDDGNIFRYFELANGSRNQETSCRALSRKGSQDSQLSVLVGQSTSSRLKRGHHRKDSEDPDDQVKDGLEMSGHVAVPGQNASRHGLSREQERS